MKLFDMHCHLDFLPDADALGLAREAEAYGIRAFSNTVTPAGFERARALFGACGNVRVGVGLHPWWVAGNEPGGLYAPGEKSAAAAATSKDTAPRGSMQATEAAWSWSDCLEQLVLFVHQAPFVGEVGLDFAPRHEDTREEQIAVFDAALDACTGGGKVISIHAVRSVSVVLNMLEAHGTCASNECILHWFSGTSDELTRAIRLGCYFSINPRMFATKRGRAYVRAIPRERLLLETDMPADEGAPYSAEEWDRDLRGVLAALTDVRDEYANDLGEAIARTSVQLLER